VPEMGEPQGGSLADAIRMRAVVRSDIAPIG
jgi:hypothetical protein